MEIPGYQIEGLIAEGGMSTVYLAVQESLGRRVAIKVLRKFDNVPQAERFLHEARIIASLEHRNVITIYDVGSVRDRYYIAMEYLEGGSLADRIGQGMQPTAALDLLESVANCLDFVHRRDIVHRDIKPGNILFHADGTPKLTDFGIAKQLDRDQELTLEDSAFGSPYYLSPEQAEGRPLDGRSDIYSLGIVFFQMLTGRRPYAESSHIETIVAHLSEPIPVLPDELSPYQGLLERMIAKSRENRVASAQDLIGLIRKLRSSRPKWNRRLLQRGPPGALAMPQPGPGPDIVSRMRETSPRSRALAVALVLLAVIGIARSPDDDVDHQPAATLAARVPDIELRYDGGGTAFEPEPPAMASVAESAPIPAASGSGPAMSASEPLASIPEAVQPQTPVLLPEMAEETLMDPPSDMAPVAETAAADQLQPVVTQEADETNSSRELVEELMQAGDRALEANRLTTPAADNAFDHYSRVAEIEPGHSGAMAGLDLIADRYSALAQQALGKKDYRRARVYTRRGLAVRRNHAGLLATRSRLDEQDRIATATPAPADPVAVAAPPKKEKIVSRRFEGTSVTSTGPEGTGNLVKDFKHVWRSVFD